jgi:S-adenosyl methyltransferase
LTKANNIFAAPINHLDDPVIDRGGTEAWPDSRSVRGVPAAMLVVWPADRRVARSREQIMEFFAGCRMEEPGLVNVVGWRPDAGIDTRTTQVHMLGGVGRKA